MQYFKHSLGDDGVAFRRRMNSVALHQAGITADAAQQERDQRQMVLRGEIAIDAAKRPDVVRTIIRRQRHSGQNDFRSGFL